MWFNMRAKTLFVRQNLLQFLDNGADGQRNSHLAGKEDSIPKGFIARSHQRNEFSWAANEQDYKDIDNIS